MGCSASTLDTEQSVTRCKNRKHFIKLAVQHQHAFAAAHAAYIISLKNTGAAIRQFGEGETKDIQVTEAPTNTPNPQILPPPLPHFLSLTSRSEASPISRAVSMPPLRSPSAAKTTSPSSLARSPSPSPKVLPERKSGLSPVRSSSLSPQSPLQEEEEEEEDDDNDDDEQEEQEDTDAKASSKDSYSVTDVKPSEPTGVDSKEKYVQTPQNSAKAGSGKNLNLILREIDDQFLTAFESGKGVAKLLEARKMHYHSNFVDNNDSLDHSKRVLRVMSWGRNPQLALANGERVDTFPGKEKETHASTLDKLLAWEKKLHDEVKAGELIRIELERKSVQLKSQKRREDNPLSINKTKGAVKTLQTRYLVEIQAVDAAASEVDKLRDECLHNQLVDLVNELMAMWECMLKCHQQQYQLIESMGSIDSSYAAPSATNDFHLHNTLQLESEITNWNQNFDKLISTQKGYINAVYHWLRLHIIQIESDGKDMPGSPQKMSPPPVYYICRAWLTLLDQFPDTVTSHAIKAFSSLIHELTVQQGEELKQKRKLEGLRRELERKEQSFRALEAKHNEKRLSQPSTMDEKEDNVQENGNPLKERERMVHLLRETVEAERDKYELLCTKSGSMTVSSLEKGLPPLLNAIKEFARTCSECYKELHALTFGDGSPTLQISYK